MAQVFEVPNGKRLEELFDPDLVGDGPIAWGLQDDAAVPLRFAHIKYGSKGPDVGYFTPDDIDVSNLWAAKNSAVYVNDGGVPRRLETSEVGSPAGVTARAGLTYHRSGLVDWFCTYTTGTGNWTRPSPNAGDPYDLLMTIEAGGNAAGTLAGDFGAWVPLSADRQCTLSVFANNGTSRIASRVVRFRIRRRSDGVILVDYTLTLWVEATSDG